LANTVYKRKSEVAPEQITIHNNQFARFVSRRKGVSASALSTAIRLLSEGVVEAMAEGYNVQLFKLGTFEIRKMPPRMRYHRITKQTYMAEPFHMVHFKKSPTLIKQVRKISKERLAVMLDKPTLPKAGGTTGQ